MKTPFKNYLSITKTEWNGMVVLVLLIIAVLAAPYIGQLYHKDTTINFKDFEAAAAQLRQAGGTAYTSYSDDEKDNANAHPVMFVFNPNHLPVAQWQKLGLSPKQIKGIKNYEAKGGRFYTKADVKKMYTLSADDYRRLEPYINIPGAGEGGISKPFIIVELNSADSAKLTQLKGIGPGFAMRIIHYRNRLGGFYSKQQVKEVFGLDESRYDEIKSQITVNPHQLKKIHINGAEFDDLKNFPYLSYKQVNAIIQYRKQHGDYESLGELKNIEILDDEILRKIAHYLVFK